MKWRGDGFNWLIRLEKGEMLVEALTQFAKEQGIRGAWISGLGGATWAKLGFYDLTKKQYKWQKLDQLLEITSLQGNLAWSEDKPVIHLHGTFSDDKMQAYGGHVKELEVAGTCELHLHKWYEDGLNRKLDDETGLNLLDL